MTRAPIIRASLLPGEILVDSFAGGGGASEGMRQAFGHGPHLAINHDEEAIALHSANHPETEHRCENVWQVDPVQACRGRRPGLAWFSPDCTHFSKAKGGKPVDKEIRGLAYIVLLWAVKVRPRVIGMENVEEFKTWGPLGADNKPDRARARETFDAFIACLTTGLQRGHPAWTEIREFLGPDFPYSELEKGLGYDLEHKELRACDYGSPTIRKRLFLVARCDGRPIVWPKPTHGPALRIPYRTAADCIDWSLSCPSIFLTKAEVKSLKLRVKRPLAENTMNRIARGLDRFVLNTLTPFIVGVGGRAGQTLERGIHSPLGTLTSKGDAAVVVPYMVNVAHGERDKAGKKRGKGNHSVENPVGTVTGTGDFTLIAPTLIEIGYGERKGQAPRAPGIERPLGTLVASGDKHYLVAAFLAKHFGGHGTPGVGAQMPLDTVTARDHHALVTSHLVKLYGTSRHGQPVVEPMHTISAQGGHIGEVRAFLVAYYGTAKHGGSLAKPMRTVTPRDRFGLVIVHGAPYMIVDIGMRMLSSREKYRAQGFDDSYKIDIEFNGKPLSEEAKGKMCGNSVNPQLACAIVSANFSTADSREAVA